MNKPITEQENLASDSSDQEELSDLEENKIGSLETKLQEEKDKFIRKVAEFENYKRRTAMEMLELRETAGKDIILGLLEVLDDCERAEQQMEKSEDIASIKEGVSIVFKKLRKTLQDKGVNELEAYGKEFNVEEHEALTEITAPNEGLVGKVMEVIQKGYYMKSKLIRFAKVVVGK
jgi:molecular chaperone GrpE